MANVTHEPKMTLEQLEEKHKALTSALQEYLLVIGVEYLMVNEVIRDLKDQMYMHADQNVNDMIADLINLETDIVYAREEQQKMLGRGPQQY